MKIILSPAKTFREISPTTNTAADTSISANISTNRAPALLPQTEKLVRLLKKQSPAELAELMTMSKPLSELNYSRYQKWVFQKKDGTPPEGMPAVFAFKGDVYQGLNIEDYNASELKALDERVRILSGLYGLLRPLDAIQPYRLIMGTPFETKTHKNLYAFWGDKLANALSASLKKDEILVNLASNEYFKALKPYLQDRPILTPVFKDWVGPAESGQLKIVSFKAKYARGLMTSFIIKNKITSPDALKTFNWEGYFYDQTSSKENMPVFVRGAD